MVATMYHFLFSCNNAVNVNHITKFKKNKGLIKK